MSSEPKTAQVKSWIFTTTSYPETLHQGTSEVPTAPPTPTSVIIKPHAVSLNPVDIQLMNLPFNNAYPWNPLYGGFAGPKIAGRDFSGTVTAAGPDSGFSPGDAVMGINMAHPGTGFLSERVILDLRAGSGANVIAKPTQLSWTAAASLPCVYLTARTSIAHCEPYLTDPDGQSNRLVVLGGSSATGIYTVKLAKARGWTVLASCSHRNARFVADTLGADETVDYTSSPTAVVDAVRRFQPGAIVDCVGGTEAVRLAPQFVTIVGDKTGRNTMGGPALYWSRPRMVLRWLMGHVGLGNGYECIILDNRKEWLEEVQALEEDEVVIDSVFEFEKAKEAFERLDTGRARGKVVVKVVDDNA